ncbi:MAG TPA: succinate dehydrogenase, cytochrome b556 subunit [Acidiferrobacteraceae bacterium]|nr:succinate dehydrogenase, cytochrome b556 subunit [Acidiferrobacteraceae bacterium]
MYTKKNRPVFLNLLLIRLPVGGVLSITHRITGVLLSLAIPAALYLFELSLSGEQGYQTVVGQISSPLGRLVALILVVIFVQHFLSGLRHLLLDLSIGEDRVAARRSAWLAFIIVGLCVLGAGSVLL